MNDLNDKKKAGKPDEHAGHADAAANTAERDAAGAQAAGDERVAALERELDEAKSRLLRSAADYQNAMRRSQQSVQEAREQQLMDMAKSLLTVLDHFDRALEVDVSKVPAQKVLQGVQIVRDELNKMLDGYGIRRIEARTGEEFDPTRHEAMLHQDAQGVPANHVTAQLQPGYSLGERTLRPAKVAIAK